MKMKVVLVKIHKTNTVYFLVVEPLKEGGGARTLVV